VLIFSLLSAQSPTPNAIEVILSSTQLKVAVIDRDDARLLAPILDRCHPGKLAWDGFVVSRSTAPSVVRVRFYAAADAARGSHRLSRFEREAVARQIRYHLQGRKALVVDAVATTTTPGAVTTSSSAATIKADPATAAPPKSMAPNENRVNSNSGACWTGSSASSSASLLGRWTCFLSGTRTYEKKGSAAAPYEGAPVQLVREPENVR
jgi:hypothetical protein